MGQARSITVIWNTQPQPLPSPRWSTSHMPELDMHVASHEMIVSATAMAPPFHGNLSNDTRINIENN